MRIGILGSAFNPIHNGHLHIARHAIEKANLDKVLLVPSNLAPTKKQTYILPAEIRLKSIAAAIGDDTRLEVSDVELQRGGLSYTVDTLRQLQPQHPEAEFFFIIGSDLVETLPSWKDIGEVFQLCTFLIINRPKYPIQWQKLKNFTPDQISQLQDSVLLIPPLDIASSEIRDNLKNQEPILDKVPKEVENILTSK